MKRILVLALYSVLGLSSLMAQDYTRYVDPRIGSEGLGRTFPGPCMPYGMAKISILFYIVSPKTQNSPTSVT